MKLIATMMMSLDGVIQGPGGPDEDRRGGFERGGWAHHNDEEGLRFLNSMFERADALLLGRKTWEIFEGYWPHHHGDDPVSHGINVLPKYVPSTTLKDPTWQNTHVIDRRRRGGDPRAQGPARARDPGPRQRRAAPLAARARPRRRAQPADLSRRRRGGDSALPGARPEPRADAGRVADDAVRDDAPDISAGRTGDLRDRRGVTSAPRRDASNEGGQRG